MMLIVILVGEVINYSLVVTNDGNITLYNPDVTDIFADGPALRLPDIFDNDDDILNPGELWSYSVSHSATQADIDNGEFINTASVISLADTDGDGNGDDPISDDDSETVAADQMFDLALEKDLAPGYSSPFNIFDDVLYQISVINEGNTTAFSFELTDRIPTGTIISPDDTNNWIIDASGDAIKMINTPLAPGETHTEFILLRIIPEAAQIGLDMIENYAEITGAFDSVGIELEDNDSETDNEDPMEDDQGDQDIEVEPLDPLGYIYCEKTGRIVTGGRITITGPGNIVYGVDENGNVLDGSNGIYQFFVDAAGTYQLSWSHPLGFPLSTTCNPLPGVYDPTGQDGAPIDKDGVIDNVLTMGSDATNGYLNDITCSANDYFMSIDINPEDPPLIAFNNVPVSCVLIRSIVCEDTNQNGISEPNDPGRDGIDVYLYDCFDLVNPIAVTTTANGGQYEFDGLDQGCYRLFFDNPAGYGVIDNPFVDADGWSEEFVLDWGDCYTDVTYCITQVSSIGDRVWKDSNGNGIQDAGENGASGVTVNLLDCNGNIVQSTTTNGSGNYSFDNIFPGDYIIQVDNCTIDESCAFTFKDSGSDDNLDSDVDASGQTDCLSLLPGVNDISVDIGLVPLSSVGDFVWEDSDGDGFQDPNEPGISDVIIQLYTGSGFLYRITTSDEDGYYEFDNLYPGDYYIKVVMPDTYQPTLNFNSDDEDTDSNLNSDNREGTTNTFSTTLGSDLTNIDIGLVRCVPIGETVWFDYNENDQWDENENGINQLKVELYRFNNGSWVLWDVTYTGHKPGTGSDDGYFKFCAMPGRYYLKFVNPPTTFVAARANRASEDKDSDITGRHGEGTTDDFEVFSGDEKCNIGAGYYKMGTIGDFVWYDSNENGMREAGENGVSGITVQAINIEGDMIAESVTDNYGRYMIDYLPKDDYYLHFDLPDGFTLTTPNQGSNSAMDSNVDGSNGPMTTPLYQVLPGEHVAHVDAGVLYSALPVIWSDIWGENRDDHNYIEWILESEINVSHYVVQRSYGNIQNFEAIGDVASYTGNGTMVSYDFNDYDVQESGVYYYRIKQYDLNGIYDYSKIVAIDREYESSDIIKHKVNVYPVPVVEELTVDIEILKMTDELSINIYDAYGQLVRKNIVFDIQVPQGIKQYKIDMIDMAQGVYNLEIKIDKHRVSKKLIVLGK